MMTYFDTSAFVKLVVLEDGSNLARAAFEESAVRAISLIGYVEARAALARALRMKLLTPENFTEAKSSINSLWDAFFVSNINDVMVRYAGALAERHNLRGYDSVHLASALTIQNEINETISFAAWDRALLKAASNEGLHLVYLPD